MGAANLCVPKGSPSCLLPLQEALQNQQMGLTLAPFKLPPLLWDSEHVRFCMSQKSGIYVSYSPPALQYASPIGLHSQMFLELIFSVLDPWGRESDVELRSLTPWGRTTAIVIILPFVGHLPRNVGLHYTESLPFLSISSWLLLNIFTYGQSFLVVFMSFSSIVAL